MGEVYKYVYIYVILFLSNNYIKRFNCVIIFILSFGNVNPISGELLPCPFIINIAIAFEDTDFSTIVFKVVSTSSIFSGEQ